VFVRFEGEEVVNEVEKMIDEEIIRWAVRERALAATFTRPVTEKEATASGKFEDARAEEIATLWNQGAFVRVPKSSVPARDLCKGRYADATKESGGKVLKYKSRLVAKGYSMIQGEHYGKRAFPTPCTMTILGFFMIATFYDLVLGKFDVGTAYIEASAEEDGMRPTYLEPPFGFEEEGYVWKMQRALYGRPDAGQKWWATVLVPFMVSQGFEPHKAFPCFFFRIRAGRTKPDAAFVHVDDIQVGFADEEGKEEFQKAGEKRFKVFKSEKTTGVVGIDIEDTRHAELGRSIKLYQETFINEAAERLKTKDLSPVDSPWLMPGVREGEKSVLEEFSPYHIWGILLWMRMTQHDTLGPVGEMAKFASKPKEFRFQEAEQVMRYLQGTAKQGVRFFQKESTRLTSYPDANWKGDWEDRRARLAVIHFMLGGSIHPVCMKRTITVELPKPRGPRSKERRARLLAKQAGLEAEAMATLPPPEPNVPEGKIRMEAPPEESTCEAEIYALDACLHGQAKIANFVNGIAGGKVAKDFAKQGWDKTPVAYEDNRGAIELGKTNVYRQKLDHIDLRYAFVNDTVLAGKVLVEKIPSDENYGDINTKKQRGPRYTRLVKKIAQM